MILRPNVVSSAGLKGKPKAAVDTEAESQYSGHSSATSLRRDPVVAASPNKGPPPAAGRLNNGGSRVKRSGSSATSPAGRQIPLRQDTRHRQQQLFNLIKRQCNNECGFGASVVNDYADTVSANIFVRTKHLAKPFLPVHMGFR